MARMIPDIPPERGTGGSRAEGMLFQELKHGLPQDFLVFYGLGYLGEERAREGEVDFLVVHRELGMLAVECKGGGVSRDRDGRWWRHGDSGRCPMGKSPMDQAQENAKALLKELTLRWRRHVGNPYETLPLLMGHALAFPLHLPEDTGLPLEFNRKLLLSSRNLAGIEAWIRGAFEFWRAREDDRMAFDQQSFKRFNKYVLNPKFGIMQTLAGELNAGRPAFVRATEQQYQVIDGLLRFPRLRVEGGAGSGKTMLAAYAAEALANQGLNVLLLCYTRGLCKDLRHSMSTRSESAGRIDVSSFHIMAFRFAHDLELEYAYPPDDDEAKSKQFWMHDTADMIRTAIRSGAATKYDAIIVDESQDFPAHWWELVLDLFADPNEARLLLFCDPHQDIFERGSQIPEVKVIYPLTYNLRNTQEIGKVVTRLGDASLVPHPSCPGGEPPEVFEQTDGLAQVEELVTRLFMEEKVEPRQITILTPHSRKHSFLAGQTQLAGFELADKPGQREDRLLHCSIGAFKGLESDIVIMADIDPADERCNRKARYVAASRAMQRLYVFGRGDWLE